MTPIKQICQDKRQDRRKEMATRSREKEIREGNGKHYACEQPPGRTALEKYQDAQKRCYGIKHISCGGDQKSARRSLHCITRPHRRASAAIQRKYSAHHVTAHSSDPNNKQEKPKRRGGDQNLLGSKTRIKNSRTAPTDNPTSCNGYENAESD